MRDVVVGVDLAWSDRNATGVCVLDDAGRVVDEGLVMTDAEIVARIRRHASPAMTVAVDAPLLVPNREGRRPCENELARVYGARRAGPHSANRTLLVGSHGRIRGEDLARELAHDRFAGPWSGGDRIVMEVFPHPALIEAFALPERLAYKRGRVAERRTGLRRLHDLMARLVDVDPPLMADGIDITDDMTGRELKAVEDLLDARVCAWVGLVWRRFGTDRVRLFGDPLTGHIAVPIGPFAPSAER